MRHVTLPATNRRVSITSYVAGIKLAKANPDMDFKHGLTTWWPTKGRDIVKQFREGMNQRINDQVPYINR